MPLHGSTMASFAFVLGLLTSSAIAIDYNTTGTITNTAAFESTLVMCNTTFDRANGTGIYTFTPGLAEGSSTNQGNGSAFGDKVQWAIVGAQNTVPGSTGYGLQLSLMFSPGQANYFNDASLGYDACAFGLNPGIFNSNTYRRSQSDNGSCLQTLDSRCKAALQDQFDNYTAKINQPSQQSSNSIGTTCNKILTALTSAGPPHDCTPFLNTAVDLSQWIGESFTLSQSSGTTSSNLATSCKNTAYDGSTFYNLKTLLGNGYSDVNYLIMTTFTLPMVTVFMPVTDGSIKSVISRPYSDVSCVHVDHTNPGSSPIPALPPPDPVDYSSLNSTTNSASNSTTSSTAGASSSAAATGGITGGAIAGIVIGVVALAAIVAAGAFILLRRRRTRRNGTELTELDAGWVGEKRKHSTMSEAAGESVHELSPDGKHTHELPSPQPRHELPSFSQKFEMDGGRPPVELPGSMPDDKEKPDSHG